MSGEPTSTALIISKILGTVIILGSLTVKVPLIRNCIAAKSTKGLSESSVVFELLSCTIYIAYNFRKDFPVSVYGELISVVVQVFVILGCIFYYNNVMIEDVAVKMIKYLAFVVGLFVILPNGLLFVLPIMGMGASWSGLIPQILENTSNKHTGTLSLATQFLQGAGALLRTFTILTEVDDPLTIFASIVGSTLQNIVLGQIIYYSENTKKAMKQSTSEAKPIDDEYVDVGEKNARENALSDIIRNLKLEFEGFKSRAKKNKSIANIFSFGVYLDNKTEEVMDLVKGNLKIALTQISGAKLASEKSLTFKAVVDSVTESFLRQANKPTKKD